MDAVGTEIGQHRIEAGEQPFAELVERLILRHDREIALGHDAEQVKNLLQHGIVLPGNDDVRIDLRRRGEGLYQWRHLDCFGPGTEY